MDAVLKSKYPALTKELLDYVITVPYSLHDLLNIKVGFCLTDTGVKAVTSYAAQRGIHPYTMCSALWNAQNNSNRYTPQLAI